MVIGFLASFIGATFAYRIGYKRGVDYAIAMKTETWKDFIDMLRRERV
jgi:hypothetical protein